MDPEAAGHEGLCWGMGGNPSSTSYSGHCNFLHAVKSLGSSGQLKGRRFDFREK